MSDSTQAFIIAAVTLIPAIGTGLAGRTVTANQFAALVFFFVGVGLICSAIERAAKLKSDA